MTRSGLDRRSALGSLAYVGLAGAGLSAARAADAAGRGGNDPVDNARARARRGQPPLKITDVKVILTQVGSNCMTNVKVFTSEPGLYGVGCGTHAERPLVVATTIEKYLKPFVVGRNADEIEKIWQELWVAPYWRASVDASNAMSAIDGALWDILGKRAGVPVHDVLGGKVRDGLRMLADVRFSSPEGMEDDIRARMADGYRHFRVFLGRSGGGTLAGTIGPQQSAVQASRLASGSLHGNDGAYINELCLAFEHIRKSIGFDIDIGHDVHERPSPQGALVLAKAVEQYRPFFIEDLFAPEDSEWYKTVRAQSGIGIAMGELFVNQNEWLPLVSQRLVDYIRMHISAVGGLSLARKVAATCEFFGIMTAWHGPANVSPVGHAVNMHLDYSVNNFGIHEGADFSDQLKEIFPGAPEIRHAIRYSNGLPGLGVDIDEKVAAKYPLTDVGRNRGGRDLEGAPKRP